MASDNIKELDSTSFESTINANAPVLVDFWAPWCGPCKAIAPILEEVAEELSGQATIAKVNVDENASIAQKFSVRAIPTMIVFKDGQNVDQLVGMATKEDILTKIKAQIA